MQQEKKAKEKEQEDKDNYDLIINKGAVDHKC